MRYIPLNVMQVIALLFCSISISGWATCSTNKNGASAVTVTAPVTSLIVQRDATVGSPIGTIVTPTTGTVFLYCDSKNSVYYGAMVMFTTPSSVNGYYNTNLPGIGVSMGSSYTYPATAFYTPGPFTNTMANTLAYNIKFVKTGNVTSGSLNTGLFAAIRGSDNVTNAFSVNLQGVTITQTACSITTTSLTFPIGDVLTSKFGTSVGALPAGAQSTQNLGLNCDAGANINVSLSGTQNPDVSTTSVLALTGQGNSDVAKGVGVQLLYNGSPLVLNNQIVLKQSSGGQETFPLTARYYQTKTSVSTGTANATATLNLTYQ